MRYQRLSLLIIILGLMSGSALAQSSGSVLKVKPAEETYKVKRGSSVQVSVIIDIDDGYHINSNRPAEAFLIATSLKVERMPGIAAGGVLYPKAKIQKFEFSEKPMSVYEGKAVLKFTARALASAAAGSHTLKAKLRVQACNNQACLRPQTLDVEIPLEVM